MKKSFYHIISFLAVLLLLSCSTKKNTRATRFYHSFTTRYNIYYNGKVSFDESLNNMQRNYKENYTDRIHMYPISAQPKDKANTGGPFDRAIEKSNKAIKLHSIRTKPARKPGWRNDPKQVALQDKEEYNPFLKHSWLMLGQGQFYNADFLQAAATFSYISRHYADDPEVVAEAKIWQARAYSEMAWYFEAEDILSKLNTNGIPKKNRKQYEAVMADYLIKEGRFEEAVPYLRTAIKAEKNKLQRTRMKYLLGQIYTDLEMPSMAYDMFRQVPKANPPYELEFAARIRQTEVFTGGNYLKMIRMLERMGKQDKNQDFLDQVYYAIGNIYISREDTVNAIANYEKAVEKSTLNGMDKAIAQIRVGDLYFQMGDYIKAQPHLSGALAGIQKEYKDYKRVAHLSSVLDELVIHAEAVHLQDSLQTLARMPEEKRLAVIDKIIEQVIKEEEEAKKEADREAYLAEQQAQGTGIDRPEMEGSGIAVPTAGGAGGFYFYNPQTVAQGKTQFQRRWGRRTLEDNWRRSNKKMTTFDDPQESLADGAAQTETPLTDEEGNVMEGDETAAAVELSDDPKTREYYIQQLPLTEEDIAASDLIIEDGLFHMAMIYKDKLEDFPLSIHAFEDLERRFPEHQNRLEGYYQIFLMAIRIGDKELEERYKQLIIREFPESDYAIAVADPDYEYNIRMMDVVQDSIYQATYDAYLDGNVPAVRGNYQLVSEKYPLAKLMPKFMFLDALSYVETADVEGFKEALRALLEKYPNADVSELAGEMLKGVLRGRTLVQGSIRSMTWNLRFGDEDLSAADSARVFKDERQAPHRMMLIFPTGSIDRNQLLFAVAAYNFAHFLVKEVDLSFEEAGPVTMLMITGFYHFDEIVQYYKMIHGEGGYAQALNRDVSIFPISEDNYETLMRGKTLDEYVDFFEETYGEELADMIARWRLRQDADEQEAEEEAAAAAERELLRDEPEAVVEEPVATEEISKEEEEPIVPEEVIPEEEEAIPAEEENIPTEEPIEEVDIQPADSTAIEVTPDSVPALQAAPEEKQLTLEEIEEIRRREAEEKAAQEAEELARKEQERLDREALLVKQKAEEEALLKAKAEQEKQQEADRKAKLKQAEKDRKARLKAQEQLRKQKEKDNKARLKQREKDQREKEKLANQRLKEREAAARKAQKEKEAAARARAKQRK
ncbi:hypothetical protein M2480_001424 [Parabacteroides sp. PFB2-12]|uniref:type IX secretion system periplasmic lipoprotein PorW/SprE n=1 Tax=Parabacteroides sp. PFB2-12 TaxID=2940652 RepID=UPI0024766066|nr:hypothetical protein [Parabacteroides sp. PFB2-12]MDH6390451.1 hypothetical protein [Parabacteroides sp. PFB2-12]